MTRLIAVLTCNPDDQNEWVVSLQKNRNIQFDVINISKSNWLEKCLEKDYSLYLLRAPGITNVQKQMFDERIEILYRECKKLIYPNVNEIKIYENKKYLAYWLKSHSIPAPDTRVFYIKEDALDYVSKSTFPLVGKINVGASGKGVKILRNIDEAYSYINTAFKKGIKPYIGPNFRTSSIMQKLKNAIRKKGLLKKRITSYQAINKDIQRYVILQEFVPHDFEWRTVVIGDSYFAHKKLITGVKASGSLKKDYSNPPISLLDFVRNVCINHGLSSVSIDIFEVNGTYLVNEIQTFFGQSDSYQMKVNDVIGRYKYIDNSWIFEAGDFNTNQCYDLRLEHALNILAEQSNEI